MVTRPEPSFSMWRDVIFIVAMWRFGCGGSEASSYSNGLT
jgi:hypothetical protein